MTQASQIDSLREQGFVVVRGFADAAMVSALRGVAQRHLDQAIEPIEYEADLRYPGAPGSIAMVTTGFPAWLRIGHFLNLFFMAFIIRAGVQILADHPRLYWRRDCTPGTEWFRFQKDVPTGRIWTAKDDSVTIPGWLGIPGIRHSIGLARWWHFSVNMLWTLNGIAIYVLLGIAALAIDRRALLVSALAYVLYAMNQLFETFGAVRLNIALTALVIGSALLLLSAFWHQARAAIVDKLPDGLRGYLPATGKGVSPLPA